MSENEKKELNSEETGVPSGGWGFQSKDELGRVFIDKEDYAKAGVTWKHHRFAPDEYIYKGKPIPKGMAQLRALDSYKEAGKGNPMLPEGWDD